MNGLIALEKPAGLTCHPNSKKASTDSLINLEYDFKEEAFIDRTVPGIENRIWLLHRIDSGTSGIVLLSTNNILARTIKELYSSRKVFKSYHAVVFGHVQQHRSEWNDRLGVNRNGSQLRAVDGGPLHAHTSMKLIKQSPGVLPKAIIELNPSTGRTHQLRFQCFKRGLPIIGDKTYGDFQLNRQYSKITGIKDRLHLHLSKVSFTYTLHDLKYDFSVDSKHPFKI
eukprot:gene2111-4126_t